MYYHISSIYTIYLYIYIIVYICVNVPLRPFDSTAPGLSELAGHLAGPRLGSQPFHPAAGAWTQTGQRQGGGLWENHRKTMGKPLKNWKTIGKPLNRWKIIGKP